MLADLERLEVEMDRQQSSLRHIVFGADLCNNAAELPGGPPPLQTGAQWSGKVGPATFHMVICFREDSWVEAVGIWPGHGAARMEGRISAVSKPLHLASLGVLHTPNHCGARRLARTCGCP